MNPALQFTETNHTEMRRQAIVRLVGLLFVLLIFEGALRKWVMPQLANPLLFIRDPFLLVIYYMAVGQNRIVNRDLLFFGLGISLILVVLAALQIALDFIPAIVGGYGLRNYVLYLPLPFVMYSNLTGEDVERLLLRLLKISVPLGALGVVQSFMPVDHWLNSGVGDGEIFTAGNQARTYGTFSFTAGHTNYITFMVPLAAGALAFFTPGSKPHRWATASLVAMGCAAVTSGSRGVIVAMVITMLLYVTTILLASGGRGLGRLITSIALLSLIGTGSYLAFEDRFQNIAERFALGAETEGSIIDRGLTPLTKLSDAVGEGAFIGVGIGKGTGGGSYLVSGEQSLILSEDDTLRIIQECGAVVGLLYISFRVLVLVMITRLSFLSLKYYGNSIPFLLLAFLGPSLIVGQITLNNTSNGFNWLGVGFCLSLTRLQSRHR